jgi:hypothetical protein
MRKTACIVRGIVAFDNRYPKWDMRPQFWLLALLPKGVKENDFEFIKIWAVKKQEDGKLT